ncbi:hypothetical protein GCM10022261_06660 [Brevibacterium daeguense]|uniref:Uncharacterized protein n=1 Tax=Brevibacterium daeguense TaxID=909936 RepID=A0ABP8EGQ5_9MICO|nr:hypothetical protein [Brevibacterium daeguense]
MTKQEREHTLSRTEQMWITAEINGPGWNLFYGIALIVIAIGLAISVIVPSLELSATAIALAMAAAVAFGGVFLSRLGLRRVLPLQRLRHDRSAHLTEEVEFTGVTATRDLLLQQADSTPLVLRGPLPSTAQGEPAEDALLHEGQATLARYSDWDEQDAVPARLTFSDGCHAIGYVSRS